MQRIDFDDEDAFDIVVMPDGRKVEVLKDHQTMRVPMRMADAAPRTLDLHDGRGNPVGNRPGYIVATDRTIYQDKQRAYDEYDAEMAEAYKNSPTGAGSREFVGQREGDINGAPGHLRRDKTGQLVCRPDRRQDAAANALDARGIKDAAYQEYDQWVTNAWQ